MVRSSILILCFVLLAAPGKSMCEQESDDEGDCDSVEGPSGASRQDPCATVRCGYGAECVEEDGRARCVCPSVCPAIYDPICGDDGKTYSNSCQLRVSNCEKKTNVQQARKGEC